MQAEPSRRRRSRITREGASAVFHDRTDGAWMNIESCRAAFLHLVEKVPLLLKHMAAVSSPQTGGPSKNELRLVSKQFRDDAEAGATSITWNGGDDELTKPSTLASLFAFQNGRIMEGRLSNVNRLDCRGIKSLMDLNGIPRGLIDLCCDDCSLIHSLVPLVTCTKLHGLYVSGTIVSCLKPLFSCTRLSVLRIDNTKVTCLKPLAACVMLQVFTLGGTPVKDLSPLTSCIRMQIINLRTHRLEHNASRPD